MKSEYVNKIKIACVLNYLIFFLSFISFIIMFTGIKFSLIDEPILETTKMGVFKFFTVDSNLLMGIVALLLARQEKKLLLGRIKEIPTKYYVLKLVATVSVSLTMLVVFLYLGGIADGGLISLLQNSNLFFHFVIPFLSIIIFTIFERSNKITFGYVMCGLIPVLLYGLYYVFNILYHLENGVVLPQHDWYYFAQNGMISASFVAMGIIIFTYVISLLLWIINREKIN